MKSEHQNARRCSDDCVVEVLEGSGIMCHAPDCPVLKAVVETERRGICSKCGVRKVVERDGLVVYCPKGCSYQRRGEAALEVLDASGAGWVRDVLADGDGDA